MLRDRHAQGVHPHRGRESLETTEDRGEPLPQEDLCSAEEDAFAAF